ncbi:uncharacterized protein LOC121764922 [Salvia splendens]|uniref:uncharacterized protein LOC121764922 n=1 Tax=Salvia splendens TaxID=180675 RepID=UPI001C26C0B0|nr:uncharacterized protein LOC121764922 [Salvia splendens]
MVLPIPRQSSFLYTVNWTPTLDFTLVQTLMRLKKKHGWDDTIFPCYFFVEAQGFIEEKLGYAFKWEKLYDRLHFLELRYTTFNIILDVQGTLWNCDENSMVIVDHHLEPLMNMNPLTAFYNRRGEPAYNELTMKEVKGHTVINISDSPSPPMMEKLKACMSPLVGVSYLMKMTSRGDGNPWVPS